MRSLSHRTLINMHDESTFRMAFDMARNGATRGMIIQRLRKEHLNEQSAVDTADRALATIAIRTRLIGLGQIVAGLVTVGLAWLVHISVLRFKIPIAIAMFGVFLLGIGMCNFVHRTDSSGDHVL